MAKINATYEAVYILDPALDEEKIAALVARFKTVVEGNGTVSEIDEWGKRRLAYPIKNHMGKPVTEGYYVLMTFTAAAALPAELDRIFRITEGVLRSMIVCKDQ
ncbi:MAG: 30S ribosomal protein S6 [Lawsonibacter sp.]|nr:30S ribosomal protein S6 [Lawsonibacter sp.]